MPLLTHHAARRLGLSVERVKQLDRVLKPRRTETNVRIYDAGRVDFIAGARAAAGVQ